VHYFETGCDPIVRVSGCRAAGDEPPCVYVAIHHDEGAWVGNYKDENGEVWVLAGGRIEVTSRQDRVVEGNLEATYTHPSGSQLEVRGVFRACRTLFPPCAP
jgi:hypothetical protein